MKKRIFSTLALWACFIAIPILFGKWGTFLLVYLFGLGTVYELNILLEKAGHKIDRVIAMVTFSIVCFALAFIPPWEIPPLTIFSLLFAATVIACLMRAPIAGFTKNLSGTLTVLLMTCLPFGLAIILVHELGLLIPIWILAVAKFTDAGALLFGMWLGKTKMSPILSPKKTWEGLVGGVFVSILVSVLFVWAAKSHLPLNISIFHAAWMAVPIALSSVLSDLAESAIKREAKVKDSGAIIPGIGGCLDLTDSLLLALPTGYFLIWMIL